MSKRPAAVGDESAAKKVKPASDVFVLITSRGEMIDSVEVFQSYASALAAKTVAEWEAKVEKWEELRNCPLDKLVKNPIRFHVKQATGNDGKQLTSVQVLEMLEEANGILSFYSCISQHGQVALDLDDYGTAVDGEFDFRAVTGMIVVSKPDRSAQGYRVPEDEQHLLAAVRMLKTLSATREHALADVPEPYKESVDAYLTREIENESVRQIYARRMQ